MRTGDTPGPHLVNEWVQKDEQEGGGAPLHLQGGEVGPGESDRGPVRFSLVNWVLEMSFFLCDFWFYIVLLFYFLHVVFL